MGPKGWRDPLVARKQVELPRVDEVMLVSRRWRAGGGA